jgi:hypothetical protein
MLDPHMQRFRLEFCLLKLDVGDSTNHFEELYELDSVGSLVIVALVRVGHLAEPVAVLGLFFCESKFGVLHHQIDAVFLAHELMVRGLIKHKHSFAVVEIGLKHVIDLQSPKLVIPELLPWLFLEIRPHFLVDQILQCIDVSVKFTGFYILKVTYPH